MIKFFVLNFSLLSSILFVIESNPISVGRRNPFEGDFFEGDILGVEKDEKGAYVLPNKNSESWPNGVVPYIIDPEAKYTEAELDAIEGGMKHIEEVTKLDDKQVIKFVKLSNETDLEGYPAAIRVIRGDGCYSYVGMIRRLKFQNMSIGDGCAYIGVVAHELMHALGFTHEHSRPDRDDWVTVYYENIQEGYEGAFNKFSTPNENGITIGLMEFPYEYESVLHYGTDYFSKNGKPTMLPKIADAQIGNSIALTYQDALEINAVYSTKTIDELLLLLQQASTTKSITKSTTKSTNSSSHSCIVFPLLQLTSFLLLFYFIVY